LSNMIATPVERKCDAAHTIQLSIRNLSLSACVFMRADFNVALEDGRVMDNCSVST
jgi:3-phosphoglycerate kinase